MKRRTAASAGRVTVAYLILGTAWIVAADYLVLEIAGPDLVGTVQVLKGLAFIVFSGGVLYYLVQRELKHRLGAEARLEAARVEHRELLESLTEGIVVRDREARIVYANPAAATLLGVPRSQLEGIGSDSPWSYRNLDDEAIPAGALPFVRVLEGGSSHAEIELQIVRPDGSRIAASISANAIRRRGDDEGVVCSIRNLSEQYEAQRILERRETQFQTLFESVSDVIAVLDVDGALQLHTPSTENLLGYDQGALASRSLLDLTHPDDRESLATALATAVEAGLPQSIEFRITQFNGDHRHLYAILSSAPVSQLAGEVVMAARDVTIRKRAEDALRESQEQLQLAQRLEAIGRLAGGVAHDFNNLMTAVLGYVHMLQDEFADHAEAVADLEEIARAARRANSLTRQLLTFSRREVVKPQPVHLGDLVRNVESLLRRIIGEDITLDVDCPQNLPNVVADPGQLEQVVMNLAVNARDAMPEGGTLRLHVRAVNVVAGDHAARNGVIPGDYIRLVVQDTGLGMDEEVQGHIFEPFYTTKSPGKGTGLGLSTVYGIISQSHGHIRVTSTLGAGTSVHVYLPAALGDWAHNKNPSGKFDRSWSKQERLRGHESVLIVEDEENVRRLCRIVLERLGYRVRTAADGRNALTMIQSGSKPDLLITDVILPEMDGRRLVEKARRLHPDLNVLFMSGYTDDVIVRHRIEDGAVHFLEKPFGPTELAETVRAAIDDETPAKPATTESSSG